MPTENDVLQLLYPDASQRIVPMLHLPFPNETDSKPLPHMPNSSSPDLAAWPVLDTEALYGLAGEVVRLYEPHTEADPVALLVSFSQK